MLDFCAGSCTTAVAAAHRGRPVLCGELQDGDGYLGTGQLRVAAELGGCNDADPLQALSEVGSDAPDLSSSQRREHLEVLANSFARVVVPELGRGSAHDLAELRRRTVDREDVVDASDPGQTPVREAYHGGWFRSVSRPQSISTNPTPATRTQAPSLPTRSGPCLGRTT